MLIALDAAATTRHQLAATALAQKFGLVARTINPGNAPAAQHVALGTLILEPQQQAALLALEGVSAITASSTPTPLCSRVGHEPTTVVSVGGVAVGGAEVVMMAGPCAVESLDQLLACARAARAAGAHILRGGAFKPRSSPYAFMGLEGLGLDFFAEAKRQTGLRVVTEVMAPGDIERVSAVADALQVGARNMQNYPLLRALGQQPLPVLLKRGLSATYAEWLGAAEYIYVHGNGNIILCERGIRTFEPHTRNTLDVAAVPVMAGLCHLPMIVDPSHGTGHRSLVPPMARAAVAAGADGVMVEAHPTPDTARSDGPQSLTLPMLEALGRSLIPIAAAVGRSYTVPPPESAAPRGTP